MRTTRSTSDMRARCGTKCEPMTPPAPATTMVLPAISLSLRHPLVAPVERGCLGANSAGGRVRPTRQPRGLVVPDAAVWAADGQLSGLHGLAAARAEDGPLAGGKFLDACQRLGGVEQGARRVDPDLVAVLKD